MTNYSLYLPSSSSFASSISASISSLVYSLFFSGEITFFISELIVYWEFLLLMTLASLDIIADLLLLVLGKKKYLKLNLFILRASGSILNFDCKFRYYVSIASLSAMILLSLRLISFMFGFILSKMSRIASVLKRLFAKNILSAYVYLRAILRASP